MSRTLPGAPARGGVSPLTAGVTVLAPVAWGTTYVTITEVLPQDRPFLLAATRVAPAGLLLVALGAARGGWWRPKGAEWVQTALLALFNFGLFFPLLIVAIYRLPGGVAAIVGGAQPLLVVTLSWLLSGERPQRRELAVGLIAVAGVGLVVGPPDASVDAVGVLAAAGANVSFALGVVCTKLFPPPANRLGSTGVQMLVGSLLLVPLAAIVEGHLPAVGGRELLGFAYLSIVATGAAFVVWFEGIRRLPRAAPPLLGLAAPITGAVLGWLLLGQALSGVQIAGFVVVLAAIGSTGFLNPPSELQHRSADDAS